MARFEITNRCPKCKGGTFSVTTRIAMETSRGFENGVQTWGPSESSLHTDLASYGECECGHEWRFRDPSLNYIDDRAALKGASPSEGDARGGGEQG